MTSIRLLYITTKDREQSLHIGECLLEEKLVACINVIEHMESMYFWKGNLEHETESILLCKTTKDKVKRCIDLVKKVHTYEVPCVLSIPLEDGNKDYLDWVKNEIVL